MGNIRAARARAKPEQAAGKFTKARLYRLLSGWRRAVNLADLGRGGIPYRVAYSLAHYAQRRDSVAHYYETGILRAYPSQARLARELRCSAVVVGRAVKLLENARLVSVDRKLGAVNSYRLLPPPSGRLSGATEQVSLGGQPPNLRTRNHPRRVGPNIPSIEGDYESRSSDRGAGRSLERRPAAPPRSGRSRPLVKPITEPSLVSGKITRWKRLADGKAVPWKWLTDAEREDVKIYYTVDLHGTYRRRKKPFAPKKRALAKKAQPPPSKYDELARRLRLPNTDPERFLESVSDQYHRYKITQEEMKALRRQAISLLLDE